MSDTPSTPEKKPVIKSEEAEKATEEAETAPEPAPEPKPLPKEPRKGVYTLEAGDTPGLVSIKFYGRSNRAGELVKANESCDWQAGSVINLV